MRYYVILILSFLWVSAANAEEKRQLHMDDAVRHYTLFRPEETKNAPTIIALHGGGGEPEYMRKLGFNERALPAGWVIVYPQGVARHWNDGRSDKLSSRADDVGFISSLIEEMVMSGISDPENIFVTGISNGAMMTYRLACQLSDKITAVATVSGNLPEGYTCKPGKPIPMLIINGTSDPWVQWNGGKVVPHGFNDRGSVLSTPDTVSFWLKHHGCDEDSERIAIQPKQFSDDPTTVKIHRWPGCPVVLYEIEKGGHLWPGKPNQAWFLPEALIGPISRELDATATIWEFFKSLRKVADPERLERPTF